MGAHEHTWAIDPAGAALLASVGSRDEAALGELSERYHRLIFGVALRITGDRALAEEVVQDTLYAVWRSAHQFQPDRSVAAWLSGLARHRAIDTLLSRTHRARLRERGLAEGLAPSHGDAADAVLLRQTLLAAIATLEPAQGRLVELAFFADLSHTELAARLGLPLGTVKSRLRAALGALRLRLDPHGAEQAAQRRPQKERV